MFFSGVVALFGWCALVDGFGGGFRKIAMLVGCIFVLSVPTGSRLDGGAIASSRQTALRTGFPHCGKGGWQRGKMGKALIGAPSGSSFIFCFLCFDGINNARTLHSMHLPTGRFDMLHLCVGLWLL